MLKTTDEPLHFNYLRVDSTIFEELFLLVGPHLEKQVNIREPIASHTRLQICLSQDAWMKVAADFESIWNFPHCLGAIDGKHIAIEAPPHSGSVYYNYKKFHSFNLTGIADAHYRFIIDVGSEGRRSDAGVFAASSIKARLETDSLNVPAPSTVGQSVLPYVFVGNEAYPLTVYLMRPYPKK
ncbi:nuclease harbi1 [Lasius niger]|uniref:Nuclease harbi1 n=1 Tax=Lasius niger TaxID=67767 RepID=A0A0J7N2H5_LASNI|nr:nuclease harbi1 [Lasius niger]